MVVELSLTLADLPNQKPIMDEPKLNVTAAGWLHCSDRTSAYPSKAAFWPAPGVAGGDLDKLRKPSFSRPSIGVS
jgi:hypothetical protein